MSKIKAVQREREKMLLTPLLSHNFRFVFSHLKNDVYWKLTEKKKESEG